MTGCDASVVSSVVSFLIELIGVGFREMKKAILILVLSLMLSGNANTAFDSKGKLTFDRCKGENYKGLSWEINLEKSTLTLFGETTIIENSYSGNSSTTVFAYNFKIATTADVEVIIQSSTGTETVKTLTTHYSVGGAGSASGGNVTMVTAPATGETLVIRHATPQTQSFKIVVFSRKIPRRFNKRRRTIYIYS